MLVICIDDTNQDLTGPCVIKGRTYTVYDTWTSRTGPSPLYYYLVGFTRDWVFRSDMFADVPLIEDCILELQTEKL